MQPEQTQDIESVKGMIREAGLRATPARIATLKLLLNAKSPLTHSEVSSQLADSGVDRTTVFRNLNVLANAGLLRKTELGDHVWRFEVAKGCESSAHPHFICVDCGTISCLTDVKLTANSLRMSEKFGTVTEILLRGHCSDCS